MIPPWHFRNCAQIKLQNIERLSLQSGIIKINSAGQAGICYRENCVVGGLHQVKPALAIHHSGFNLARSAIASIL